jgi:pimeloyl-ACP methyl ester carboxylesterase
MISPTTEATSEEILSIHGYRIHVRMDRRSEGRPLLLLNGLTRPLERWDPFVAALGDRSIVRFDPPGIGTSPSPLIALSIPALAKIATGVLDAVGVPGADVLGYSHGGAVAQQLCHQSPDRIGSMVLAATTCGIGSALGGLETLAVMLSPERSPGGAPIKTDPLAILYRLLAISCWTSIPFLGSISKPTLIVSGDRDRLVPSVNGRILADRIPGAVAVTVHAGHDLQHPRCVSELASLVEAFLNTHA